MISKTYGDPNADIILIQPVDGHDLEKLETEISLIRDLTDVSFGLIAFAVDDWNDDLSPWEAPLVFGKHGFGGGAAGTLEEILAYIGGERARNPDTSMTCGDNDNGSSPRTYIIGGYSLAGLFALWAAYQTDTFSAVAAASPSVWFPGFTGYINERSIHAASVYLSLGDKESKAKNLLMATVADKIRETYDIVRGQGAEAVLEWNPGNHFADVDIRTARAFAHAIEYCAKIAQ